MYVPFELTVTVPLLGLATFEKVSEVESTKSVSDIYAPVAGTVVAVNDALADSPERLNDDPYGDGWICIIEPTDASAVDALLDVDGYRRLIEGS